MSEKTLSESSVSVCCMDLLYVPKSDNTSQIHYENTSHIELQETDNTSRTNAIGTVVANRNNNDNTGIPAREEQGTWSWELSEVSSAGGVVLSVSHTQITTDVPNVCKTSIPLAARNEASYPLAVQNEACFPLAAQNEAEMAGLSSRGQYRSRVPASDIGMTTRQLERKRTAEWVAQQNSSLGNSSAGTAGGGHLLDFNPHSESGVVPGF